MLLSNNKLTFAQGTMFWFWILQLMVADISLVFRVGCQKRGEVPCLLTVHNLPYDLLHGDI